MLRFKRSFVRPLLLALMLVIGPVHAQAVYACAMMDMDMAAHDECPSCAHGDDSCCERSVEICIDEDDRQTIPSAKSAEMRADPDRSQSIGAWFDPIEPPQVVAIRGLVRSLLTPGRVGSNIYLITQRLRI